MGYWSAEPKKPCTIHVCMCKKPHVRCPRPKLMVESKMGRSRLDRLIHALTETKQYGHIEAKFNGTTVLNCYGGNPARKPNKEKICPDCDGSGIRLVADVINREENCIRCGGGGVL